MPGKKQDARVRYTKMVVKSSLLELMQTKPVAKITVTEICEKAGINRATFLLALQRPHGSAAQHRAGADRGHIRAGCSRPSPRLAATSRTA